MAQKLVPEAKESLAKFKNEVANEMGVQFTDYNGNLSSKECGSVGGEMVKRMVESYESKHADTTPNSNAMNSNAMNSNAMNSNANYNKNTNQTHNQSQSQTHNQNQNY